MTEDMPHLSFWVLVMSLVMFPSLVHLPEFFIIYFFQMDKILFIVHSLTGGT